MYNWTCYFCYFLVAAFCSSIDTFHNMFDTYQSHKACRSIIYWPLNLDHNIYMTYKISVVLLHWKLNILYEPSCEDWQWEHCDLQLYLLPLFFSTLLNFFVRWSSLSFIYLAEACSLISEEDFVRCTFVSGYWVLDLGTIIILSQLLLLSQLVWYYLRRKYN